MTTIEAVAVAMFAVSFFLLVVQPCAPYTVRTLYEVGGYRRALVVRKWWTRRVEVESNDGGAWTVVGGGRLPGRVHDKLERIER